MAPRIRAGTSGYSYKSWRGPFYPADLAQDEWLSFYAGQLPTVEINNTFYRMPREHVVAAWRDAVPDDFRFVIKASRRITHQHRLKNAAEATDYLVRRTAVLGERLGAVLFQLPPNLRMDHERLKAFQQHLPADYPAAFEFRHPSWQDPVVDELLQAAGHVRVVSHDNDGGSDPADLPPTANDAPTGKLVYLRLRASEYSSAALKKWHASILLSGARDAYVFFKHEDDGTGPALARSFLDLGSPSMPGRSGRSSKQPVAASKPAGPKKAGPTRGKSRKGSAPGKRTS